MSDLPAPIGDDDINFEPPDPGNLDERTVQEIVNAWEDAAIILQDGRIVVDTEYLHSICRTDSPTAREYIVNAPDARKISLRGKKYIEGSHVISLIDTRIQDPSTIRNEKYAKISEEIYRKIRDSDAAWRLRREYNEMINISVKKMKEKRISKRNIKSDELTNQDIRKSEFSHIRSQKAYPYLADKLWNGLIVNSDTHSIISTRGCTNEEELVDLCSEKRWNKNWYQKYKHKLKNKKYRLNPSY